MSNSLLLRSLVMYGACVLIAVFLGYQISTWDEMSSLSILIIFLALMLVPFLLKWHYFWMIATWNTTAMAFLLPGRPSLALTLTAISLVISLLQHAINQEAPFIHVRPLFWPLVFMTCVIVATMKLTGGLGLNITGSANVGGKRYIWLFGSIAGYFALTAQRIPAEKVVRYATIFFLSPVTNVISDISLFLGPSAVYYIFLLFPSTGALEPGLASGNGPEEVVRFSGIAMASSAVVYTMLARYGLKGIFGSGRIWRAPFFLVLIVVSMFGGFRSILILIAMTCVIMFWLEGLYNSRLMPVLCCGLILAFVALIPLAEHLPFSVQRTLSVVPFLKVGDEAAGSARASSDWRVQMWEEVLPEIRPHLIIGKGYSINFEELEKVKTKARGDEGLEGAKLAGDYHNGPLSVIIPFGIGGVIAFLWLIYAGIKVLHHNFKYGDPAFSTVNAFLLAYFVAKFIFFLTVFGSFSGDMGGFLGLLGMSVAINGGMRQAVPIPQTRASDAWKLAQARPAALN
jgi:O-Antigen ligase